ncbi:hypothetical protein BB560_000416 [Smittium megazygosporum]|uniref:Non-specific serine/threonine protein kinase n=1 Tax=Smittium megazygosporum TaxID=133381 RepID=A0A2T9ZKL5_9FUNG|nr:hypothetical protein BB560_000416 [Smittium megazygosporum]
MPNTTSLNQNKKNFFGKYLLLQTIGEGEFAKVKLALQLETGDEFAIKLVRKDWIDTEQKLEKIEREISVLKTIDHPFIVKLHDIIESDKYIGLVLEYASGGELFDHILAHNYLNEKDARRIFAQLISSVSYLHNNGVVHRDLKLENLLLDYDKNVKITDFGFANFFDSKYGQFMMTSCGSPCYAAPELIFGDGMYAGTAVDIWSCGVILYAMLAGYLPYDDDPENPNGNNINRLYQYIISSDLTFPDRISPSAQSLLNIILVANPKKRATIEDIINHEWLSPFSHLLRFPISKPSSKNDQILSSYLKSSDPPGISSNSDALGEEPFPAFDNIDFRNYKAAQVVPENSSTSNTFQGLTDNLPLAGPEFRSSQSYTPQKSPLIAPANNSKVPSKNKKTSNPKKYDLKTDKPNPENSNQLNVPIALPTIPPVEIVDNYLLKSSEYDQGFDLFKSLDKSSPNLRVSYGPRNDNSSTFPPKSTNKSNPNQESGRYPVASSNSKHKDPNSGSNSIRSSSSSNYEIDLLSDQLNIFQDKDTIQNVIDSTKTLNIKNKSDNTTNLAYSSSLQESPKSKSVDNEYEITQSPDSAYLKIHNKLGEELGVKIGAGIASVSSRRYPIKNFTQASGKRAFNWVSKSSKRMTSPGSGSPQETNSRNSNQKPPAISQKRKPFQRLQLQNLTFFSEGKKVMPPQNYLNGLAIDKDIFASDSSNQPGKLDYSSYGNSGILQEMRTYNGPVNPNAISSVSPSELFQHILRTLDNLGLIVVSTHGLSVRVLRPNLESAAQDKPIVIGATYPIPFPLPLQNTQEHELAADSTVSKQTPSYSITENSKQKPNNANLSLNEQNQSTIESKDRNQSITIGNSASNYVWSSPSAISDLQAYFSSIETRETYVSPSYNVTPVDGSTGDRGIHGYYNKARKNSVRNSQISNLTERLKSFTTAVSKTVKINSAKGKNTSTINRNTLQTPGMNSRKENPNNEYIQYSIKTKRHSSDGEIIEIENTQKTTTGGTEGLKYIQRPSTKPKNIKSPFESPKIQQNLNSGSEISSLKRLESKCAPVPPPYGQSYVDKMGEVQFVIEVCKMKNFSHLFLISSKRRKGSVWSYKYLYHLFMDSLDLKNYTQDQSSTPASIASRVHSKA